MVKASKKAPLNANNNLKFSLFLGFRTNSAYQRWWEARKIWGEIINNSRTFARQVLQFGKPLEVQSLRHQIIERQLAWNWFLAYRLRNLGWTKEGETRLPKNAIDTLKKADHKPNLLLLEQEKDLNLLVQHKAIDDFYFRSADATLKELCDSMGKCERIKKTVFPTQYSLFTLVFINMFLILLPLGLTDTLGYYTIPIQVAIGFTFGMIQNISESMQNPFDNKPNDIPIFAISRTIERDLLEIIEEKNLPSPIKANQGILM